MTVLTQTIASDPPRTRWGQLGLGLVAMMAISSPQYVWTLFVKPFQSTTGADLPSIQITFSLLIVLQTGLSPLQGWMVDRFGSRLLITVGCLLSGLGWISSAYISGIWGLYLTYGLFCGVGTGIVYVGIVGLMVRWFPDRRGFAAGVVAAGYGFGAILTTFPIDSMIASAGYQSTLVTFGAILGIVGALAALGLREPAAGEVESARPLAAAPSVKDVAPTAMLKTPVFWLLFVMMTMMSTGGLMVISQFASFAKSFGVADTVVFGLAALPFALTFDRVTNGLTRPFFGWVSDRIGREYTMLIAFMLEAASIWMLLQFRDNAALFVLLSGVVFFGWGEIFSLFPSTLTDTFGTRNATTNYGFLYMAQGIGSVLGGPVAAMVYGSTGSWLPVFGLIIAMDAITALLAVFVLKPMRANYLARR
ncbi:oxalate/formate MFS antiporter [Bradyrhizobium sp. WD16]|uniref:oxalate/formate MFS antiporter n=1 Tax=Bradyrhizobium sp. WD16 TaxID=1521768 RepID=UPI0020A529CD|nr:oxalate/formate MFS antiporter [Bradyrhizobium sp. WD16]UTD28560.1 oxalate/formate MFS antiporter [Bradyrhizobium sp. WD16]